MVWGDFPGDTPALGGNNLLHVLLGQVTKTVAKDGEMQSSLRVSVYDRVVEGVVRREGEGCPSARSRWVFEGTWHVLWS